MKQISVITLLPNSGRFYASQLQELFGDLVSVRAFCQENDTLQALSPSDLYLVSTDAFEDADTLRRYIPLGAQIGKIQVTFYKHTVKELQTLPKNSSVLFVNATLKMARESVSQLEQFGLNHLHFTPYGPDASFHTEEQTERSLNALKHDLVITPDELDCIPGGMEHILNIGHRPISVSTIVEAALRLGLDSFLESSRFREYAASLASENYSFDELFGRSRNLERRFDLLVEILDEGLIGVDEAGKIFVCNQIARKITGIGRRTVLGLRADSIFPQIPFAECMQDKTPRPSCLIQLQGTAIQLSVSPILQKDRCIGAFATVQRFQELERRQNALRVQLLNKGHRAKYTFDDIIGNAPSLLRAKALAKRMALTDSPMLLIGETGTGKELFAHAVHLASRRQNGPFIALNVAAMPENLLESELFGYEEGAFTGAKRGGKPGLFEFAQKGTLFLDEVEGMSLSMQIKLLRVLQEHEIMRVGGTEMIHIDVRIITATNQSLEEMVEAGSFRRDLYYRLNTFPVLIPPLRTRGEDILNLLETFRKETGGTFNLTKETKEALLSYDWPGNIRELRNVVEYLSFTEEDMIRPEQLPPTISLCPDRKKAAGKKEVSDTPDLPSSKRDPASFSAASPASSAAGLSAFLKLPEGFDEDSVLFVLSALSNAAKNGSYIGREGIRQLARKENRLLSQKEIRDILTLLSDRSFVKVGKGRGGSRITAAGKRLLQTLSDGGMDFPLP